MDLKISVVKPHPTTVINACRVVDKRFFWNLKPPLITTYARQDVGWTDIPWKQKMLGEGCRNKLGSMDFSKSHALTLKKVVIFRKRYKMQTFSRSSAFYLVHYPPQYSHLLPFWESPPMITFIHHKGISTIVRRTECSYHKTDRQTYRKIDTLTIISTLLKIKLKQIVIQLHCVSKTSQLWFAIILT